ncbi:MAG: 16S rRNA processing protein RimM [Clostridia bacterium]|nr:16S rRNA processing protein RimM [Clostridia bacterium]
MKKMFLECGRVTAPHGVRGLVKAEAWCDSPRVLAGLKRIFLATGEGEYEEHSLISASVSGQHVLLAIDGYSDRDAAVGLKGRVLYAAREDIPLRRGAMFIQDMIGLPVVDIDTGRTLGTLSDVSEGVRTRLYTVRAGEREVLIPDVPEFIKEIDPERGVQVHLIPGFFDEV